MVYEVKVTVKRATKLDEELLYVIKTENETNAKIEALNCARRMQVAHPTEYKSVTFSIGTDAVKVKEER